MRCAVPGCTTGARIAAKSLCWTHYQRKRRKGSFDAPKAPEIPWARMDFSGGVDGCWTWMGGVCGSGYPHINRPRELGGQAFVHRWAWETTRGPIPNGMTVDHLCFNTLCCNPFHLRLLTASENSANKRHQRKRANVSIPCPHRVNGRLPNRYLYVSPKGDRSCRACQSIRYVRWQREKRASVVAARRQLVGAP